MSPPPPPPRLLSPLRLEQWPAQPLKLLFWRFFPELLACARCHRKRGKEARGWSRKGSVMLLGERRTPQATCRRCSSAVKFWEVCAVNGAAVAPQQVWLVSVGSAPSYWEHQQNANVETLAGGCAGGKAKRPHPPGAARRGPSVRHSPGGSGSPSRSALLHEIGSHLATARIPFTAAAGSVSSPMARVRVGGRGAAFKGREVVARRRLQQVLQSDCKGHRVASWTRHRNKAGKGHTYSSRRPWTLVQIYQGIWKSKHGGTQREPWWLKLPLNSSF